MAKYFVQCWPPLKAGFNEMMGMEEKKWPDQAISDFF